MDQIGELGLGTGDFDAATNRAIETLKSLGTEAVLVTGNLVAMAAVVAGTLAAGIYQTRKRAEELKQAFQDIKNTNAFNDSLVSVGNLEDRIKSLNAEIKKMDEESIGERIFRFAGSAHLLGGKGFDASEKEQEEARAMLAKEIEHSIQRIGKREEENLKVLQLQKEGRKEESEILKSNLEYNDKIAKAIEKGSAAQAVALARERNISEELIKQKYLRERQGVTSDIANEQAKLAIANKLNDANSEQIIKDREADRLQKRYDDEATALRKEEIEDNEYLYEQSRKETAEAHKRNNAAEKILEVNKRTNKELENQIKIENLLKQGKTTQAARESMEQEFERKIREARRDVNPEGARLLEQQREQARQDFDIDQANKSPRQRANERKGRRAAQREIDNGKRRLKDLDDKIARGVTGDPDSEIENRKNDNRTRAAHDKQSLIPAEQKGYTTTDRALLQQIRDSLTNKDG